MSSSESPGRIDNKYEPLASTVAAIRPVCARPLSVRAWWNMVNWVCPDEICEKARFLVINSAVKDTRKLAVDVSPGGDDKRSCQNVCGFDGTVTVPFEKVKKRTFDQYSRV